MNTCTWTEDEDGAFETGCGDMFDFTNDGPSENGFKFCPYCGGELATIQQSLTVEDEEDTKRAEQYIKFGLRDEDVP